MNLPRYNYFTNDFQDYEFYSDGPKGKIKKLITFSSSVGYTQISSHIKNISLHQ